MESIIEAALGRSRTVLSLLIFLLIAGSYAYKNIPKERRNCKLCSKVHQSKEAQEDIHV